MPDNRTNGSRSVIRSEKRCTRSENKKWFYGANHTPNYTTPHDVRVFQREDNGAEGSHGLRGEKSRKREKGGAGLQEEGQARKHPCFPGHLMQSTCTPT